MDVDTCSRRLAVLVVAIASTGCATGPIGVAATPVASSAATTSTTTSLASFPVASPATPVTTEGLPSAASVVTGLEGVEHGVQSCLVRPDRCVVDQWAQPGSPAAIELETLRQYYLASGLVARIVPSRTYVVVSTVTLEGRGRARVQLCAVDGSWQMDSRGTTSTADDIVWNDALVSRRETQVLVSDGVRWRRYSVEVTAEWPGENRCGPRSTS